MLKTLKWVYRLGVTHERHRIRTLIAEHRHEQPTKPADYEHSTRADYKDAMREYERRLNVWREVGNILTYLTEPEVVRFEQVPVRRSPLEED